jgi:hypothetical protein
MIAENGVKSCQGPGKLAQCPDTLSGMPAADGVILADSNWGNAEMALLSLDPAVVTEGDGAQRNPELDLFAVKNGYNPNGNSNYSKEFIAKWQAAVAKREDALIKYAQERVVALDAGNGGDEPLVVVGGSGIGPFNKLFPQDTRLLAHTVKAWPLLHADGSSTTGIVPSVRKPARAMGGPGGPTGGTLNTTVRNFLLESAVRVSSDFHYDESSVHGVQWTSTYSSTPGNVTGIRVPSLFMGMTGNYEYLAAETIHANSAATDKTLVFVEGASHMYTVCRQCEATPGQYGDTVKTLYDYADRWLSQKGRF